MVVAQQLTGLKKNKVIVLEKSNLLGGLAAGLKVSDWDWSLDRNYHHLFANDQDVLLFLQEIGLGGVFFRGPETVSLYKVNDNYRTFPVDTPQDFLNFPLLSFPEKIRSGAVVALLKILPFGSFCEKQSAARFLRSTMGKRVWEVLWRELFRKKFGKYAENILAAFIWARIKKRTKTLGYIEGGFQALVDYLEKAVGRRGVKIKKECAAISVVKKHNQFHVVCREKGKKQTLVGDVVVSTLPAPALIPLVGNLFSADHINRLKKIKYLAATNLILETKKPLFDNAYWVNVCDPQLPIMGLIQHTNFIDKKNYNNHNILYVGNYMDYGSPLWRLDAQRALDFYLPYLKKINPQFPAEIYNFYYSKTPLAQPLFDREFPRNKPKMITQVRNFYLANLEMTYPYDRGINFAVKLGKQVALLINGNPPRSIFCTSLNRGFLTRAGFPPCSTT